MAVQDLAPIREYYDHTWQDYLALASRAGIGPGVRMLDAGCGVGGSAIWLAKHYDVEVVGITPVPSHGNWRGARDQFRALRRGLWFDAILTATAID